MTRRIDWTQWKKEQRAYNALATQGFSQDLLALKHHINKLIEVCPKDAAKWPTSDALSYIEKLKRDYAQAEAYASTTKALTLTP